MTVRGQTAQIRWGYHLAATVGPWTLRPDGPRRVLTAKLGEVNAFRISQRPLEFTVAYARGVWRWSILELQIQDGTLMACLGPMES